MPDRSLAEWLTLLEARHPSEIDLGLQRVSAVWSTTLALRAQNNPVTLPTAIMVGGTNGKGSCVTTMQAIMLQQGYRVGTFTSPHFIDYNERICVQGTPVDDASITRAFVEIEAARGDISLTYFEFGCLTALLVFIDANVDIMLLEVGLGGRLDAINIIDADVAVVASIGLDHQAWLGDTRELIAVEKLGIAREGRPLVIAEADAPIGFTNMLANTGAEVFRIGEAFSLDPRGDFFDLRVRTPRNETLFFKDLPSDGLLPSNKSAAIQALLCAGYSLDQEKVRAAMQGLGLTGRHQRCSINGVKVILDVAHNPAAAAVLAQRLAPIAGHYWAVASVLTDKDWPGIVAPLSSIIDHWCIAEISDSNRATKGQTLFEVVYNAGLSAVLFDGLEQAFLSAASQASSDDVVVVFGSFHTVSAVLKMQRSSGGYTNE